MTIVRLLPLFLLALLLSNPGYTQISNNQSSGRSWNAQWIEPAGITGEEYGVYYFRKKLDLTAKPDAFRIHISADNRYKLFVNGTLVSLGPARGDLYYWNYTTLDLAPHLRAGSNSIAVLVWNEAQYRPEAQVSLRTGLIIQGATEKEEILNTNTGWKSIRDKGYHPLPGYFAASTGENVNLSAGFIGWDQPGFDDSGWPAAAKLFDGKLKGTSDGFGWQLVASPIPEAESIPERIPTLRLISGIPRPAGFPAEKAPVTIPANTHVSMLLDQTRLTNAYPTLQFSGGRNAGITLSYAESMYEDLARSGMTKGNRNEVDGKDFSGRKDSLTSNGASGQSYTTLNYRTYRYLRLNIDTREQPLLIEDLYGTFTAYPFKATALIRTADPEIQQMLDIGWRTARLNAVETYMDCPYYEQLQYIGDTRIQAMVSYYYSGDDRLARNALDLIDHSRLPEGITQSRYPTHSTQIISTFSLWYIGMLHDYWMYRDDSAFIRSKLDASRAILHFFAKYQQADGSLKSTPYWTFVDWANGKDWFVGSPPAGSDGGSCIIDLQLLWAYQWAAQMETRMGLKDYASMYTRKAAQLKQTIRKKYWDASKGLYADTREHDRFSQHANSLAILTGLVDPAQQAAVAGKLLSDASLTQCTIYFKYYLHQALVKAGLGNNYRDWLGIWRENIRMGLTTWAEYSDLAYSRSDCHAWGSSPNIEFFRVLLGIDSDAPGFRKVRIEPRLGALTDASGEMPHPAGKISVSYVLADQKWTMKINLPAGIQGLFVWKKKTYPLKSGPNLLVI